MDYKWERAEGVLEQIPVSKDLCTLYKYDYTNYKLRDCVLDVKVPPENISDYNFTI